MQFHLITATRHFNPRAARALVVGAFGVAPLMIAAPASKPWPGITRPQMTEQREALSRREALAEIENFIATIERLISGQPALEYGTQAITLPDDTPAWIAAFNQGIGGGYGEWIANIGWYEHLVPGLLDTLGVEINLSTGAFDAPQQRLA